MPRELLDVFGPSSVVRAGAAEFRDFSPQVAGRCTRKAARGSGTTVESKNLTLLISTPKRSVAENRKLFTAENHTLLIFTRNYVIGKNRTGFVISSVFGNVYR